MIRHFDSQHLTNLTELMADFVIEIRSHTVCKVFRNGGTPIKEERLSEPVETFP